jgi:hypothetical protein
MWNRRYFQIAVLGVGTALALGTPDIAAATQNGACGTFYQGWDPIPGEWAHIGGPAPSHWTNVSPPLYHWDNLHSDDQPGIVSSHGHQPNCGNS